jgi:hypothetical protein
VWPAGLFRGFHWELLHLLREGDAVTLPVSLAAAAETLRDFGQTYDIKTYRAVADLIDGMLAEHAKWSEKACDVGLDRDWVMDAQSKEEAYDDVLALLVPLVRAFLPGWNPDTEETP